MGVKEFVLVKLN